MNSQKKTGNCLMKPGATIFLYGFFFEKVLPQAGKTIAEEFVAFILVEIREGLNSVLSPKNVQL